MSREVCPVLIRLRRATLYAIFETKFSFSTKCRNNGIMHGMLLNFLASHILVNDHDFVLFSLCTGPFISNKLGHCPKEWRTIGSELQLQAPNQFSERVRHAIAANKMRNKRIMLLVLPWASEKLCGLESYYFLDRLLNWLQTYIMWPGEMHPVDRLWNAAA